MTAIEDFENSIQHRTVDVLSTLQLSALLFQTEYAPDQFAKKMNAPGNSNQFVDKQKVGLGAYKYSCNTLTGGYIFCTVKNTDQITGGGTMNSIEEYFAQHKTQLWAFKHGLKVMGTAAVLLTITFVVAHPDEVPFGTAILYVLKVANDWLDKFNPDAYLPGVGAQKKK